jgi:hypothetical protein
VKKMLRIVVVGFLIVSFWATPAFGQYLRALESLVTGAWKEEGPGTLLPLLLKAVGLTAEQKHRIKEILAAHREPLQTLFSELQVANAAMTKRLLVPEEVTTEDLLPEIERISQLREQLLREGVETVLEVRAVLTPEQWERAVWLKDNLRSLQETMGGLSGE